MRNTPSPFAENVSSSYVHVNFQSAGRGESATLGMSTGIGVPCSGFAPGLHDPITSTPDSSMHARCTTRRFI
jgi:hypothetical protein